MWDFFFSFRPEDFVKDEYKRHMTKKRPKRRYTIWDLLAQQLLVNVIQIALCMCVCVCVGVCECAKFDSLLSVECERLCGTNLRWVLHLLLVLVCGAIIKRQSEIDIVSVLSNEIRKCICHVLVWDIVSVLNNKIRKCICHVLVWDIVSELNNKIKKCVCHVQGFSNSDTNTSVTCSQKMGSLFTGAVLSFWQNWGTGSFSSCLSTGLPDFNRPEVNQNSQKIKNR